MTTRLLDIREGVLSKNDALAAELRGLFHEAGVFAINVVSSPGTGKTALLEKLMTRMRERNLRVAALVGDLETDNDARRLARSGAPVRQIVTHGDCHLEAHMVKMHLSQAGWSLRDLDYLVIENVGNLVCPASYDLGEDMRLVLLSVTEGEDKPLKYPVMFNSADVAVITKMDLGAACEFDLNAAQTNIWRVRPAMRIIETSAKTGQGVDALLTVMNAQRMARK
jgi:hydrogenase nickel incorporation protein HypB